VIQTTNGVISSYDVLADLLQSIEHFVHHLKIYTQVSPTSAVDVILVDLIVGLISTLALVTQKLTQRRFREFFLADVLSLAIQGDAVKFVKNFFAVKDIKAARQRLERLMQEEFRSTAARIHRRVDDSQRKRMDGKQNALRV
jgi:hypothetical protein